MASKQITFRNKADKLFSQIIRSRGACELCGATGRLETSHIFSRRYAWTRTDLSNAFAACSACHREWHNAPTEAYGKAVSLIGVDEYERISKARMNRNKFDWESELQRLREVVEGGGSQPGGWL